MENEKFDLAKTTSVGPFTFVSRDEKRMVGTDEYRVVLYGAYNAGGLIGPEMNGIAVLSESPKAVICDQIACESTGYFGPSIKQTLEFEKMLTCSPEEFVLTVNASSRLREEIKLNKAPKPKKKMGPG